MSDAVRINVNFVPRQGETKGGAIVVDGDPEDLLLDAVVRAVRGQLDSTYARTPSIVTWVDPEYPEYLSTPIPHGLTLGAAREYFGAEADKTPPTIGIDEGRFGGDPYGPTYLLEFVRIGLEVYGAITATLEAQRAIFRARYKRARALAKDWNDGDYISPELRDLVQSKPVWSRKQFDRCFNLGPSRGPELLTQLGFERVDLDWGEEWWRPEVEE